MEQLTVKDLTFAYENNCILNHVSFTMDKGEILLLIGQSGCGKTTLLRHLKPEFCPIGTRDEKSVILIDGKDLYKMPERECVKKIGFVRQNVDNMQATDKVWHELAFGLESLSYSQCDMQRKIAEMVSFFGLESIYEMPLSKLSGGQKQIVNLAAVMVMEPELLILDEPTSQLDPIAANDFFQMIRRINQELGTTILMTEHRLEETFSMCDRVMVMDQGEILHLASPQEVAKRLQASNHPMALALPSAARICLSLEESPSEVPLNVKNGSSYIEEKLKAKKDAPVEEEETVKEIVPSAIDELAQSRKEKIYGETIEQGTAFFADELWFRYEKEGKDILKACSFAPQAGKITAILGGNGTGKSTLLHVLAGHILPYRGKIKGIDEKKDKEESVRYKKRKRHCKNAEPNKCIGILPQNPQVMFAKKTVAEELEIVGADKEKQNKWIRLFGLQEVLERHPFDLSGGEMQKLAMVKLILQDADILLLDEPGKGMDYRFKIEFGNCLKLLSDMGKTIVLVSHDVEFCAHFADYCGLFFDGHIVSLESTREFFAQNVFYTTSVGRMCKNCMKNALIVEDVLGAFGIKEKQPKIIDQNINSNTNLQLETCGETETGKRAELDEKEEVEFATKTDAQEEVEHTIKTGGVKSLSNNHKRKSYLIPFIIFFVIMPLTLYLGETVLQQRKYYFISLMLILEAILSFFLSFEKRKPKIREIMVVAMLSAITIVSRAAFYMVPNVKPMAALVIIAGVGLGGEIGFLVGAFTMLGSNVFFGQGPWTPWQMVAMGMLGFIAGIVFRQDTDCTKKKKYGICVFGLIAVMLVYGGIMNPASVIIYQENVNFSMILAAYGMGIPFDAVHAISTFVFLWIATRPMLEKIKRIKKKYGF